MFMNRYSTWCAFSLLTTVLTTLPGSYSQTVDVLIMVKYNLLILRFCASGFDLIKILAPVKEGATHNSISFAFE